MSTFKIVTFDGGGVKGALSIRIFKRLCDRYPTLLDNVDLFAGTSTGSLIALPLAYGLSPNEIDNFYSYKNTKYIFSPKRNNLFRPKYSNKHLANVFLDYVPKETTLNDLKKYVIIPSFNVKGYTKPVWEIVFFNNLQDNAISKTYALDAVLASCAAPTYFPSHKGFIDGGVIANSPTTPSIILSKSTFKSITKFDDIKLLSIGTGDTPDYIKSNTTNWGVMQWAINSPFKIKTMILDVALERKVDLEDMYCNELLKNNYFRINPTLHSTITLDDYRRVHELKEFGDSIDLSAAYNFIENIFLK